MRQFSEHREYPWNRGPIITGWVWALRLFRPRFLLGAFVCLVESLAMWWLQTLKADNLEYALE